MAKKPKAPVRSNTARYTPQDEKGKGKGKATQWDSEEEEDEGFVTSNDFATPERRRREVEVEGFGGVGGDDEEVLYS